MPSGHSGCYPTADRYGLTGECRYKGELFFIKRHIQLAHREFNA